MSEKLGPGVLDEGINVGGLIVDYVGPGVTTTVTGNTATVSIPGVIAHGQTQHTGIIGETEVCFIIPMKKPLPAANATAAAAIPLRVPWPFTAKRLKAIARSPLGATAADFVVVKRTGGIGGASTTFGTVTIAANAQEGTADPADLAFAENDAIDVNMGASSGGDDVAVIVEVVGERTVEAAIP